MYDDISDWIFLSYYSLDIDNPGPGGQLYHLQHVTPIFGSKVAAPTPPSLPASKNEERVREVHVHPF